MAQKLESSKPPSAAATRTGERPDPERERPGPLVAGPSPLPTSSRRKRSWRRNLAYSLAAPVILAFTRILWATCRVTSTLGEEHAALLQSDKPVILCYWHDEILTTGFYIEKHARRTAQLSYMVSPSVDGDLVEKLLSKGDAHVIRGSATRSGIKSLRHMYRAMNKQGASPVILPDGPIGPQYECKPGAVMLAQLTGAPILPIAGACSSVKHLKSWDRMRLPLPFSRFVIAFGEPLHVPADCRATEDVNAAAAELGATLTRLSHQAAEQL